MASPSQSHGSSRFDTISTSAYAPGGRGPVTSSGGRKTTVTSSGAKKKTAVPYPSHAQYGNTYGFKGYDGAYGSYASSYPLNPTASASTGAAYYGTPYASPYNPYMDYAYETHTSQPYEANDWMNGSRDRGSSVAEEHAGTRSSKSWNPKPIGGALLYGLQQYQDTGRYGNYTSWAPPTAERWQKIEKQTSCNADSESSSSIVKISDSAVHSPSTSPQSQKAAVTDSQKKGGKAHRTKGEENGKGSSERY